MMFASHTYHPGLLIPERRIGKTAGGEPTAHGHKVDWSVDWTWKAGSICAILCDPANSTRIQAGADPRRGSRALGR